MKKNNSSLENKESRTTLPDMEIIDLEQDDTPAYEGTDASLDGNDGADGLYDGSDGADGTYDADASFDENDADASGSRKNGKPRIRFHLNMHLVFLAVVILFVAGISYKIMNWGQYVDLNEIFKDGKGTYEDTYDEILPLINADGKTVPLDYSDGLSIVAFGNSPFSDDRGSADSLLNLIAKETGATIYDCSIGGSYLAAQSPDFNADEEPLDAYTLYWLVTVASGVNIEGHYINAEKNLGDKLPEDAKGIYEKITSIDFSKVDVITIMYDATDYLLGHNMYNFDNTTDITQYAGNLEASIELLQSVYPNIRIIVLGPAYAYGIDENGNYVSSDIQDYGQDSLSVYSIMEWNACASRSVTFIDNLYGTITEDNAKKYLTDNLHLNVAGRKKIAERFVYALNYFNESNNNTAEN